VDAKSYRVELEEVGRKLASAADRTSIRGGDLAQFLFGERKNRGVEIYRGDCDQIMIDRAIGDELLGEEVFDSYQAAIEAAVQWLRDA
jgi:hypothetical protein